MRFTPHQERALDLSRHLAVTANAGSGKTQVLVERYVRVLMQGVPVGEVVALTYTEKAASALRRKIAGRISGALLAAGGREEAARLESIRDALPAAFIGTIHAFCARLLREYPVEAGIDAAFTILEKVDGELMLRECMTGVLEDVLRGGNRGIPADGLMDLLRAIGRRRLLRLLGKLVAKPDILEKLAGPGGIYAQSDGAVLALWERTIREAIERGLDSLLFDLDAVIGAAKSQRRGEALAALERMRTADDLLTRAGAFVSLVPMLLTKAGGIQKRFLEVPGEAGRFLRHAERIAGRRRLLDPLVDSVLTGSLADLHTALLSDTRILLSLAAAVVAAYARRKEVDARLDFDDLQLKMRLLLSDGTVRADMAGRFRFVMVDEFQDTNTLQFEILLPLLGELSSGNLIIVGDPKQSIYRFRDADVEVFERSRRTIARASGDASLVPLGESFRPLRDIVAFVNLFFGGLMSPEGEIPYDPLVRARMNDDPGGVEILLPFPPAEGGASQQELVARRILDLVAGGPAVYTQDEHPRPPAFRDIAVLLRSRNGLEEFEQAFIRNGVPYVVSGGVGYFQTQDVYDIYNYIRFLLNTSDDVALAGILRAPFFTVSDAALFDLARSRGRKTLWEALSDPGGYARAVPSLAHASEVIAGDLALGTRLPAAELIARIIRRTGFTAALAGTVRGAQAEANLGKLLQMARSYESQGFTSLYDFAGRLERLIEEEEREGQAAIESQTDAVRIMTIHAAKGLEFPVVFVPDLQRRFQSDDEPFLDPALGIGLLPRSESVSAPLSAYLKEQARRKAVEEEQRILYVACTRARDRLLLSADPETGVRGETWLGWVERCCEDHAQPLGSDALHFNVVTSRYDGTGTTGEAHALVVPVIRELPSRPSRASLPGEVRSPVRIDIAPVPSQSKGEIFSASRIRTYVECPAKYFFRYMLGIPFGGGPFVPGTGEDFSDGDYPAELRGRVFHSVMENADHLSGTPGSVDAAVRASLAREAQFTAAGSPSPVSEIASLVRGVLGSRSWEEISAGTDVRTEYSISALLGEDFITGTIDRLYRSPDGVWTVLDYKTDRVDRAEIEERARAYRAQIDFYALMVQRLCGASSVRTRLLFAHHPDAVVQRDLTPAEILRLEEDVARIIARIKAGDFTPTHPHCNGCPMHPDRCATS